MLSIERGSLDRLNGLVPEARPPASPDVQSLPARSSSQRSPRWLASWQPPPRPSKTRASPAFSPGTPPFVDAANRLWKDKVTVIPTSAYPKDFQTKRHTILLIQL